MAIINMTKRDNNGRYVKGNVPYMKDKKHTKKTKRKISQKRKGQFIGVNHPFYGKHHTEETKDKISNTLEGHTPWNKGIKFQSNTGKTHFKLNHIPWNKGNHHTEETRGKISKALKGREGKPHSEETKRKIGMTNEGKIHSEEAKKMNSEKHKKLWQTSEYVSKQMRARGVIPNKIEIWLQDFLNRLYPNEWKFVGDGQIIISGKCPDFINTNGQKKIIELFGDYWHKGENPQDRIDIFKPFGYKTLIIWEKELKNTKELESKICEFSEVL